MADFRYRGNTFTSGVPLRVPPPGKAGVSLTITPTGDWERINRLMLKGDVAMRRAINLATREVAQSLAEAVKNGIRSQAPGGRRFKPLSSSTITLRQSKGDFSRSVLMPRERAIVNSIVALPADASTRSGRSHNPSYAVTIKPGARGADGHDIARIAKLHENGYTYVLPASALKGFFARLSKAGLAPKRKQMFGETRSESKASRVGGVIIVTVPPRPFFRPIARTHGNIAYTKFRGMVMEHFAKFAISRTTEG